MDWTQVAIVGLTAGFTLGGALGGAAVSNRHQERLAETARREARRDELRGVLTSFLVDARAFEENEWILIPAFAKMSVEDMKELNDTETGLEMRQRRGRLQRSLTEARLLVGNDGELGKALNDFKILFDNFAEKAHGPVMGLSKTQAEKDEGVFEGFSYLKIVRTSVDQAEAAALRLLAGVTRT